MPTIQQANSLLTVTTNANILAGNQFEFLPYAANVAMGFTQSATGLLISIFASSDLIASDLSPVIKATTPLNPDDMNVNFNAGAGTRLVVTVRNPTGGTLTMFTLVIITPL